MRSKRIIILTAEVLLGFLSLFCLYPHPDERIELNETESLVFSVVGLLLFFAAHHIIAHLIYEKAEQESRFWFLVTVYFFYAVQVLIRGYIGLSVLSNPFNPNVIAVSAGLPLSYALISRGVNGIREKGSSRARIVLDFFAAIALILVSSFMLRTAYPYESGADVINRFKDYSLWGSGIMLAVIAALWMIYGLSSRSEIKRKDSFTKRRTLIYSVIGLLITLIISIPSLSDLYLSLIGDMRTRSAYELVPVAAVIGMASARLIGRSKKAIVGVAALILISISIPVGFTTEYIHGFSVSDSAPADAEEVFDMIDAVCEMDDIEHFALLPERLMGAARMADCDIEYPDIDWHRTTYGEAECVRLAKEIDCRIIVIDNAIATGDVLTGNAYTLRANVGRYGVYVRFW